LRTAILSEIADQPVHRIKIRAIDELSADALLGKETCALQVLKVESQRRGQKADPFANDAGRQTLRASLNKQAEDSQSVFVRECAQGSNG
jgi:hypothetical protein